MSRSSEVMRRRENKTIAATIGYCFVIVLVVLLVMSSVLTKTYTTVLESERADAMQQIAIASSTALSHTQINEGMTYPLPLYEYEEGKHYSVDIYTKAGNSFLRLYSSEGKADSKEEQYLTGAGDEYNNCFELQEEAFTRRTENNVRYVCAIAPIISSENTVAGILEIRMPEADFSSTVNGMSLSWIFTIFSIAVSMGIIIFEINLFVSTLSRGYTPNVPVLIIYGENAARFLSFFMAFGAIAIPFVIPGYIKKGFPDDDPILVQSLILLSLVLFAIGFFGFSNLRKYIKGKLTERIALLTMTVFGLMLSVLSSLTDIPFVFIAMLLPIGFFYGFSYDSMRDYRINAGKLGYNDYDDRKIHNLQGTSYFLGASVGAVITGICFERFSILIVSLIAGVALVLFALGNTYFLKDNKLVRESDLPVNKWLELVADKYAGRFLASTFTVLGIILSFMIGFIPNYLPTVGISLATASFYYLVTAFTACFVSSVIKNRYAHILTSKVRVIISSTAAFTGFLLFAISPTAKMLVITCALLGLSLGIHDYYYLYVLFLLTNNRIKSNLRKAAEMSLVAGMILSLPVFALALWLNKLSIVFMISMILFFILAYIYPISPYSNKVDDKDPTLKKKRKPHAPKTAASKPREAAPAKTAPRVSQPAAPAAPVNTDPFGPTGYGDQQIPADMPAADQYYDPSAYMQAPDVQYQPGMYEQPYAEGYRQQYADPDAQYQDPAIYGGQYNGGYTEQYPEQYPDQYQDQDQNGYNMPYPDMNNNGYNGPYDNNGGYDNGYVE